MTSLYDGSGNRKYLNPTERLAFYRAALEITDDTERAFCMTLFRTGCRISEALALTPASIDEGESCLIFQTLKQREAVKYRPVFIRSELIDLLKALAADGRSKLFPFGRTTGWKKIKSCMAKAGLDGIKATPKGLRHGFAIACLSINTPLQTIQLWLGHTKPETTAIYTTYVGEDERKLAKRLWAMTDNLP